MKKLLMQFGRLGVDKPKAKSEDHHTPEEAQRVADFAANPGMQSLVATHNRVAARGPLALVLTEAPLEPGVMTIIRLGEHSPLSRYAVAALAGFDDNVLRTAQSVALKYEIQHPDDAGAVVITVYQNGRVERQSSTLGSKTSNVALVRTSSQPDLESGPILKMASNLPWHEVAGIGLAKVFRFTRRS